jgi:preprotein translocase subunit SecD
VAAPSSQLRAGRHFATLSAILAVLYAIVFFSGDSRTPRLGLDLQGGTTVRLEARTEDGAPPSRESLEQAQQIITDRVNGLGVAEADVVTEGDSRIVISVPGNSSDQAKQLGQTALLRFRPLKAEPFPANPAPSTPTSPTAPTPSATQPGTPTSTPSPQGRPVPPVAGAPAPTGTATPTATSTPSPSPPATPPVDPTQLYPGTTPEEAAKLAALDCSRPAAGGSVDKANEVIAACTEDGSQKLLLQPSIIEGTEISNAAPQFDQQGLGGWQIALDFKSRGQAIWADYTSKHNVTVSPGDVANKVAFVLDGKVVSYPEIQSTINGTTSITGEFNQTTATELANSLKYGALPLTFTQEEALTVSATLGSEQLDAGILAGTLGLVLVAIYALLYYRFLGLVTIASLGLTGLLTYAILVIFGRQIGFALTLAGIAGFIIGIGMAADSAVILLERLKDEVREGRTPRAAALPAWIRARRTILSAKAVTFLGAAALYYLAAGPVKGFALTLGMSVVMDTVIVFLFTFPLVAVAMRSRRLSSPFISGLGAVQAVAAARGSQRPSSARAAARRAGVPKEV